MKPACVGVVLLLLLFSVSMLASIRPVWASTNTLYVTQDTYWDGTDTTHGSSTTLEVQVGSYSALLGFDLSSLMTLHGEGATITSVTLNFTYQTSGQVTGQVYDIFGSWNENTSTNDNFMGALGGPNPTSFSLHSSQMTTETMDVTAQVLGLLASTDPDFNVNTWTGFQIRPTYDAYGAMWIQSKETVTPGYLTVTYTAPSPTPTPPSPTPTPTASPSPSSSQSPSPSPSSSSPTASPAHAPVGGEGFGQPSPNPINANPSNPVPTPTQTNQASPVPVKTPAPNTGILLFIVLVAVAIAVVLVLKNHR